jgi:hypothetical protein
VGVEEEVGKNQEVEERLVESVEEVVVLLLLLLLEEAVDCSKLQLENRKLNISTTSTSQ